MLFYLVLALVLVMVVEVVVALVMAVSLDRRQPSRYQVLDTLAHV